MIIKTGNHYIKSGINTTSERKDLIDNVSLSGEMLLTHKDILDIGQPVSQKASFSINVEHRQESEEINDKDIERLQNTVEETKLACLKCMEHRKYTQKELRKELKNLNFTDTETNLVLEQIFARYKIEERDIVSLRGKISEEKMQFLISIKHIEYSEEEFEGNLYKFNFNKEEIQLVEKEAKKPHWIKDMFDFFNLQSDILAGFKVMGKNLAASAIGSGIAMIGLGIIGSLDIKEGLEEENKLKVAKGVSALVGSGASLGDFGVNLIDGLGLTGSNVNLISGISDKVATGLGAASGAFDMALGSINLVNGIKEKDKDKIVDSSLDIGLGGISILASFNIGGSITAAVLMGLFTAKAGYNYRENFAVLFRKISDKIKDEETLKNSYDNKTKSQ
jgi:hypothetical protein